MPAIGHGIGIPLVLYLNQQCAEYCDHVGTYVATVCMILGVVLFQVGHAYRKQRKNQRNKTKNILSSKTLEGRKFDYHDRDCPKHKRNQYSAGNSMPEAKHLLSDNSRILDPNYSGNDTSNNSENSSTCEDPEDDDGINLT